MGKKEMVAMLLAGGQGNRLHVLTTETAKPAVPFGGKYRIVDFTLSNCVNSGIDTIGVLTQYRPLELNAYIGNGAPWDLDRIDGGVSILPPYIGGKTGQWYKGTANAIFQNLHYLEQFDPEYVLVLSGDHIYKMNYSIMLEFHKANSADLTIAVREVPLEEASRFGIMNTDEKLRIHEFEEKPRHPKSTKASMGVYIFTWKVLRQYLIQDEMDEKSSNDFGGDIIPAMINGGERLFAYPFDDYWKDVGTIDSLWEANMELLEGPQKAFDITNPLWRIYSRHYASAPQYIGLDATIKDSMIAEGSQIEGSVIHSMIFSDVSIGEGSVIENSVIMRGTKIGKHVTIRHSIIADNVTIEDFAIIGDNKDEMNSNWGIAVVGTGAIVKEKTVIEPNEMILPRDNK